MKSNKTPRPISDCKDGYLYHIHARNASLGIYIAEQQSFLISRFKFDDNFLFTEYHWDLENGTAKCYEELEQAPPLPQPVNTLLCGGPDHNAVLKYLNDAAKRFPDDGDDDGV